MSRSVVVLFTKDIGVYIYRNESSQTGKYFDQLELCTSQVINEFKESPVRQITEKGFAWVVLNIGHYMADNGLILLRRECHKTYYIHKEDCDSNDLDIVKRVSQGVGNQLIDIQNGYPIDLS